MRRLTLLLLLTLTACRHSAQTDPTTVVMAIENSPSSLDPRIGTDAMAERIGGLLFDSLVQKDDHFQMQPALATRWEQPDPLTWVFHLRDGVRFSDGRSLEAEDAAYTLRSLLDGTVTSSKSGAFQSLAAIDTPDRLTLRLRLKRPDASLLFNLSDGLFGVVPRGSGKDFAQHPVGSGPFRLVSAVVDRDVVLERNPSYSGGPAPAIPRIRFAVIPDAVTAALELEKGSVDIASNQLTLDMVATLARRPGLAVETSPGAPVMYLNFNVRPNASRNPLSDPRVRQAIACAIDRQLIVDTLWHGQAQLASTLLPATHWAAPKPASPAPTPATSAPMPASPLPTPAEAAATSYPHDLTRAQALLDSAGYPAGPDGIRLRLEMKTSTDDTTRLLAQILAAQLRQAGILLTLRSAEFGTFYGDVTAGRFQVYALRWIGSNEDPDIFRYALASDRTPPRGANRGFYTNPRYDALLATAALATDEPARRQLYLEAQQILARDVPVIPLWYPDNELVHTTRVHNLHPRIDGSFAFLREATLN